MMPSDFFMRDSSKWRAFQLNYTPVLEDAYIPSAAQIAAAVKRTMAGGRN